MTCPSLLRRLLLSLLLGLLLLAGCSSDPADDDGDLSSARIGADEARALEQQVLTQRARAVRERNLPLFMRYVDRSDKALVTRQRRYFRNMTQLPLAEFRYQVRAEQWEGQRYLDEWGQDVRIPQVTLSLQLDGYDSVPVRRTIGFVFAFEDGKARIVSDRTADGTPLFLGTPAPWDLTAITVERSSRVLGIFDRATAGDADDLVQAVQEGMIQLENTLPFDWSEQVVVYSVGNKQVLKSFTDVPGGSIEHLGALTFPTYAAARGRSQIASTRMLVMPSSVRAGEPFLGRITRHELSHVAIGPRDDGSPTWVSEGIAEYLGAREVPQRERIIATEALTRAQTIAEGMPATEGFNNTDQEWHYALSWMAIDYIASEYGEGRVWELMDAMHNGGSGTKDVDQDRVLQQVVGYGNLELARRAADRIRSIYG